jgi:hypothetical protein
MYKKNEPATVTYLIPWKLQVVVTSLVPIVDEVHSQPTMDTAPNDEDTVARTTVAP